MNAPFTTSDFLDVFARYNEAISLVPFVLGVMAVMAALGIARHGKYRDRWASGALMVLWRKAQESQRGRHVAAVSHRIWKNASKI